MQAGLPGRPGPHPPPPFRGTNLACLVQDRGPSMHYTTSLGRECNPKNRARYMAGQNKVRRPANLLTTFSSICGIVAARDLKNPSQTFTQRMSTLPGNDENFFFCGAGWRKLLGDPLDLHRGDTADEGPESTPASEDPDSSSHFLAGLWPEAWTARKSTSAALLDRWHCASPGLARDCLPLSVPKRTRPRPGLDDVRYPTARDEEVRSLGRGLLEFSLSCQGFPRLGPLSNISSFEGIVGCDDACTFARELLSQPPSDVAWLGRFSTTSRAVARASLETQTTATPSTHPLSLLCRYST